MSKYWDTGFYSQPNASELKRNAAASRKKEEKKGKYSGADCGKGQDDCKKLVGQSLVQ